MDIRLILAPTDFSDCSKQALSDALDLAPTFAELSLLHVFEPSPALEGLIPSTTGADLLSDLERQASGRAGPGAAGRTGGKDCADPCGGHWFSVSEDRRRPRPNTRTSS